jgi:hypothetical protein
MAAQIPKGPDPAMIYPTHYDRLSRADPEAADGAPTPFWHVNAAGRDTSRYVPLRSHTFAKSRRAQHSTARSAERSYAYARQAATQAGS